MKSLLALAMLCSSVLMTKHVPLNKTTKKKPLVNVLSCPPNSSPLCITRPKVS
ncbi:hypothetical protein [Halobacteriovorax sp. HLS]|uniref:hypothetical protein n=1 Tax=Halobacteriovorax sp. HLS TaxID=2234000 RepID=UPI0013E3A4F3|nr:hypothetical protein [Halobacteriovorax sp. HLS]